MRQKELNTIVLLNAKHQFLVRLIRHRLLIDFPSLTHENTRSERADTLSDTQNVRSHVLHIFDFLSKIHDSYGVFQGLQDKETKFSPVIKLLCVSCK